MSPLLNAPYCNSDSDCAHQNFSQLIAIQACSLLFNLVATLESFCCDTSLVKPQFNITNFLSNGHDL